MNIFIAETIGTALLILLGNGVVAACCLKNTKSGPAGWMVITTAWAFAVYVGVIAAKALGSDAHINPAVTLAFAVNGNIGWDLVAPYIGGQFLGAIIGALLVWIHYLDHFSVTPRRRRQTRLLLHLPLPCATTRSTLSNERGGYLRAHDHYLLYCRCEPHPAR